jgi:hypothetical protein
MFLFILVLQVFRTWRWTVRLLVIVFFFVPMLQVTQAHINEKVNYSLLSFFLFKWWMSQGHDNEELGSSSLCFFVFKWWRSQVHDNEKFGSLSLCFFFPMLQVLVLVVFYSASITQLVGVFFLSSITIDGSPCFVFCNKWKNGKWTKN